MTYKGPGRRRTRERVEERSARINPGRHLDQQLDEVIHYKALDIGLRCQIGDHAGCSVGYFCECECHVEGTE